jgi:hypothetical protein
MATSIVIQCELVYHHVLDFSEATQEELKLDFRVSYPWNMITVVLLCDTNHLPSKPMAH